MKSGRAHDASHARAWNGLCIAAVLVNATLENILVPALPQIRASLSLSAGEAAWLFSILLITAAVSLPIIGRLGDAYGPRRLIVGVLAIVNLGVAVAAVAHSYPLLMLGLALQGPMLCLVPLALSLQQEIRSAGQDDVSSAGLIAAASASTLVGMLLAAMVLEKFSFRLLFWATLALDFPLLIVSLLLIRSNSTTGRQGGRIDWLGAVLLSGGLFGLLTGISLSETSLKEALAVALGALVLLGAALWRFRVTREPLIELDLLFAPPIAYAAIIQFGAGFGTFGMFVILPMIISSPLGEGGFGLGGSMVSLCLLPFGVTGLVSPAAIPLLRGRLSSGIILLVGSVCLLLAPLVAMLEVSLAGFAISAALLGIGIGVLVTQTFDLIGAGLPADRVATFSALAYVLRMVGNAFGGLVIGIIAGSEMGNAFTWGLGAAAFAMLIPLLASIALVGTRRGAAAPAMP